MLQRSLTHNDTNNSYGDEGHGSSHPEHEDILTSDAESDFSVVPESSPTIQSTTSRSSQHQSPNHRLLSTPDQRRISRRLKSHSESLECLNCHTKDAGSAQRAWRINKRGELVCNACYRFELRTGRPRETTKLLEGGSKGGALREKKNVGSKRHAVVVGWGDPVSPKTSREAPSAKDGQNASEESPSGADAYGPIKNRGKRRLDLDLTVESTWLQHPSPKTRPQTPPTKPHPIPLINSSLISDPPLKGAAAFDEAIRYLYLTRERFNAWKPRTYLLYSLRCFEDKKYREDSMGKPGIPFIQSVLNPNGFKLNKPIDVQQMITHLPALLRQNVLVPFKMPLNVHEMTTRDWVNKTNFLAESLRQFYCELFEVDEILAKQLRFTQEVFRVNFNISAILQKFPPPPSATKEELIKHLWKHRTHTLNTAWQNEHNSAIWPSKIPTGSSVASTVDASRNERETSTSNNTRNQRESLTSNDTAEVDESRHQRAISLEDGEISEDVGINEGRTDSSTIFRDLNSQRTSAYSSIQSSESQLQQYHVPDQILTSSSVNQGKITISQSKLNIFKEHWDHSRVYDETLLTDSAVDFILDIHDKLENRQPVSLDVSQVEPLFTEILSLQKAAAAHVRRSKGAETAWSDVIVGDGGSEMKDDIIIVPRNDFDAFKKLWDRSRLSQEDLLSRDVVDFLLEVLDCLKKKKSVPLDPHTIEALVEEAAVLQDVAGRHVRRSERVELAWKEMIGSKPR
ncbi:hypothetical protein HDU76_009063 [Blyttiomyces sp. JEL0837]|nr:hypothetical protein HDU76_009063 [Blyttiomyces sp. JEL0837]